MQGAGQAQLAVPCCTAWHGYAMLHQGSWDPALPMRHVVASQAYSKVGSDMVQDRPALM
jgi:hypothetical protein